MQLYLIGYLTKFELRQPQFFKFKNNLSSLKAMMPLAEFYYFNKSDTLLSYYYINNFKFLNFYEQTMRHFFRAPSVINIFKYNFGTFKNQKNAYFTKTQPLAYFEPARHYFMANSINKKLKKLKSRRIFKNKLPSLVHTKMYYGANPTLQLKRTMSIFTIPTSHQLTIDFFQFTNSALQFGPFEALKSTKNFKINLFNLTNISRYFNWKNLLPSAFSFKLKTSTFFKKILPHFYTSINKKIFSAKTKKPLIYRYNEDACKKFALIRSFSDFNFKKFNKFNMNNTGKKYLTEEFLFNKFELSLFFFYNPLFFKYILLSSYGTVLFNKSDSKLFKIYNFFSQKTLTYTQSKEYFNNNLFFNEKFSYVFKKAILKALDYSKFGTNTIIWHYNLLIRFLEYCSGKKVYFRIHPFLQNHLTFFEKIQCITWSQKVKYFRRVLGPRLFLNESLQIIYLSFKLHDPFLLSNWMASILKKISFWKSKTFLRYIKYVVKYFFWAHFKQLKMEGLKYQLKGKISVAGNSRTRTAFHNIGSTSHSTFNNRILFNLNLVKTFTGVLGLKLWIVF